MTPSGKHNRTALRWVTAVLAIGLIAIGLVMTRNRWMPLVAPIAAVGDEHDEDATDAEHDHAEHAHDHAGHSEVTSIESSEKGLKNIGFEPLTIELTDYQKSLTLPAIVVERPGRSQLHITAPLTGVITKILKQTGDTAAIGEVIAVIDPDAKPTETKPDKAELVEPPAAEKKSSPPAGAACGARSNWCGSIRSTA